mmetsp:Transcript_30050/g.89294  ORF Transcript_30050/g.89294 Transcript_30050/m.89294 type:complete len:86 (+) Transcript_30050:1004-1261(+)
MDGKKDCRCCFLEDLCHGYCSRVSVVNETVRERKREVGRRDGVIKGKCLTEWRLWVFESWSGDRVLVQGVQCHGFPLRVLNDIVC